MEGRKQSIKDKSILAYTLWGAVGFGIGGVIGGAITVPFVAGFVLGAVGGASMGLVVRGWRGAVILALAGSVGFGIGYPLWFFLGSYILRPIGEMLSEPLGDIWTLGVLFLLGGIIGMLGGASLGLALRQWNRAWLPALAGAIGFGIAALITTSVKLTFPSTPVYAITELPVWGIVGGASLGAVLGYLEKQKAMQNTES